MSAATMSESNTKMGECEMPRFKYKHLTPEEKHGLKEMIKILRDSPPELQNPLHRRDIVWLLDHIGPVFMSQPMLVPVTAPLHICGDIHGQFEDLVRIFDDYGWPPETRWLFLGDYVDRGPRSMETITILFALKMRYPRHMYILRGNHEEKRVNRVYGFYEEITERYNEELWIQYNEVFEKMPVAALVAERLLCMHGGISPNLTHLDQIRNIPRPAEIEDCGLLTDLLWADPEKSIQGFKPSPRGISWQFGEDACRSFLKRLGLDMIIRAHQVVLEGYEFFADNRLVTIFSAPDYCRQFQNAGAVLAIDEKLKCKVKVVTSTYREKKA